MAGKIAEVLPSDLESVREECVKTQEELLAAVNEARCTWGELWFDKIIVAAPGTTAFALHKHCAKNGQIQKN